MAETGIEKINIPKGFSSAIFINIISPEIERRVDAGEIPREALPVEILSAFISWPKPGATPFDPAPEVLINAEIDQAITGYRVILKPGAEAVAGDPVKYGQVHRIADIRIDAPYINRAFIFLSIITGDAFQYYWELPWRPDAFIKVAIRPGLPAHIRIPGNVELTLTGRAPQLAGQLSKRGKRAFNNPAYQRALRESLPLVDPPLGDAGLPMFCYVVAYSALVADGRAGYMLGGVYHIDRRKSELYDLIGPRLKYHTRRKGFLELQRARDYIAGIRGGEFIEYYPDNPNIGPGDLQIIYFDPLRAVVNCGREYIPYRFNPLFHALINDALTIHRPSVEGCVLYMPSDKLNALLDTARRRGDRHYAGLTAGFLDVLRNRTVEMFTRKLDTLCNILRLRGYREGRRLRAARAKLDIYGDAEIIETYDIQGDVFTITPHKTLGAGETKRLL